MNTLKLRGGRPLGRLVSAVILTFVFAACSPSSNPALVGKWREKGDSDITEFRADGTFTLHSAEKYTGKYRSVDAEHIKLTFDGVTGQIMGESKWKAVVRGDLLELTDPDGSKSELQRVK